MNAAVRSHLAPQVFTKRECLSRAAQPRRFVVAHIAAGDKIPQAVLSYFDQNGDLQNLTTSELCQSKKVVFVAVPGAFLPTCSMKHLPGYIDLAGEMVGLGVDCIACVSVNDAFVMDAWSKSLGAGKLLMLADGNADFTKAMGASLDLTDKGVGIRSRRYALIAEDGVVTHLHMEEGAAFSVSHAEQVLADLQGRKLEPVLADCK